MRKYKTLLLGLLILFLGCRSTERAKIVAPIPEGAWLHAPSGFVFPKAIGDFARGEITPFNRDGTDIEIGYNCANFIHPMAATIFVYPAPSLISIGSPPEVIAEARAHLTKAEYERRKAEIVANHPGAAMLSEDGGQIEQGGATYKALASVFEFEHAFSGIKGLMRSYLYVFCFVDDKWAVEYRFSCPKNARGDQEVKDFLKAFHWYGDKAKPQTESK